MTFVFCIAWELRMSLHFKLFFFNTKEESFLTHKNYMNFRFHCPQVKLYWNNAISITVVCGYVHTTASKLSSYHRDYMACKDESIFCLIPHRKS